MKSNTFTDSDTLFCCTATCFSVLEGSFLAFLFGFTGQTMLHQPSKGRPKVDRPPDLRA